MTIDRMILANARRAVRQAVGDLLFDPNINLIDFGYPERNGNLVQDELAIRFHVYQKLADAALETAIETGVTHLIPPSLGEFSTDVPEGTYRPQSYWWGGWWRPPATNTRILRVEPLRGGISISNENRRTYGTLGGLVIDRATGHEMILSSWHILRPDRLGRTDKATQSDQRICQPGRLDGGTPADTVTTLSRDAIAVNLDAAVATLNGSRRLINDQVELGPVRGVSQAEPGMMVIKSGRRTGVTQGLVTGIEGVAKIRYGQVDRIIRNVVTIEPGPLLGEVSAPGDSGSIWLEQQSRHAVGLHFAGSHAPGRGLALDMPAVLEALNVNLATDVSASIAHSHQSCPRSTEVDGRGFTLCPDITSLQELVK
ncbi:MAG TPA: hypothetical protein VGD99_25115 [Anaerolineae bacterium]|jgi:endonuclease G